MYSNTFKTVPDAWISLLRHVYHEGCLCTTEYGLDARMVNGVLLEITNPRQEWHPRDPFCSPLRIKGYLDQFKREFIGKTNFEYTYIERLADYDGFDQLFWMCEQLKAGRIGSKRIQGISWIPKIDDLKKGDQPCFQRIWVYPYQNKLLDVHIHYRSQDTFKAFEANVTAFQELIKNELLEPTGYSLRCLRWFIDNAHIYRDDFQAVEKVLDMGDHIGL